MATFPLDASPGLLLCKARLTRKHDSILLKLAVDTGASTTMVPIEAVLALGLNPTQAKRHVEITTANGTVFVPVVTIPSFECLGVAVKNLRTICHNLPPESPVDGLLGIDFLKAAQAVLDFSRNVIETRT